MFDPLAHGLPHLIEVKLDPERHDREPENDAERVAWAALDTARALLREYAIRLTLQDIREAAELSGVTLSTDEEIFERTGITGYADLAPASDIGDRALAASFISYLEAAQEDARESLGFIELEG